MGNIQEKDKPNLKVIFYSILALGFVALSFIFNWMFLIGAILLIALNQRELIGSKKESKK